MPEAELSVSKIAANLLITGRASASEKEQKEGVNRVTGCNRA